MRLTAAEAGERLYVGHQQPQKLQKARQTLSASEHALVCHMEASSMEGKEEVVYLISKPRTEAGAVSAMYAGAACIAKPIPRPYMTLPVRRVG